MNRRRSSIESSYKSSASGTSTGIPLFSHIFAAVDGFPQSLVDPIVHIAHIGHQFRLFCAFEQPHFLQHLQEVSRAEFARVELPKKYEESVKFLHKERRNILWETASYHVQYGPPHSSQLLPSNLVLSFLNELLLVRRSFLVVELLPEREHLQTHDFIVVKLSLLNQISSRVEAEQDQSCYKQDEHRQSDEAVPCSGLDLLDQLALQLVLVLEGSLGLNLLTHIRILSRLNHGNTKYRLLPY